MRAVCNLVQVSLLVSLTDKPPVEPNRQASRQ